MHQRRQSQNRLCPHAVLVFWLRARSESYGGTKDRIEIMKWNSSNFERLVLGCIDSYDSEKRRIFQDFSRSTRFLCLRTAKTSKFQLNIVKLFWRNEMKFHFIPILVDEFWSFFREILMIFFRVSWIFSESQKMMKWLEILIKTTRKMRKKAENSGICAKFHSFISFFQSTP